MRSFLYQFSSYICLPRNILKEILLASHKWLGKKLELRKEQYFEVVRYLEQKRNGNILDPCLFSLSIFNKDLHMGTASIGRLVPQQYSLSTRVSLKSITQDHGASLGSVFISFFLFFFKNQLN